MESIYRQSQIDKLQSPDQLDKMMVITPPSFWIALLAGILIILTALIWSLKGEIPQKVEANRQKNGLGCSRSYEPSLRCR